MEERQNWVLVLHQTPNQLLEKEKMKILLPSPCYDSCSSFASLVKEQKEPWRCFLFRLLCSFQNKKPALITQQNCVIRADFFRGATLIYLFASSVETTLVIP